MRYLDRDADMPGFVSASASRENGRHRGEPVVPESASLHAASGLNGREATQELCSRPAQRLVTAVQGRCCFSRRRVSLAGFPRGSLGFCRRLSRGFLQLMEQQLEGDVQACDEVAQGRRVLRDHGLHGHPAISSESRLAARSPIASCMASAIVWTPSAPPLARWALSQLLRRRGRQRWRPAGASVVWSYPARPARRAGHSGDGCSYQATQGWPAWRAAWSRRVC